MAQRHDGFWETDIDHINGWEHCNVTTSDVALKNKLAKLAEEYPDQVVLMADNHDTSVWYHVPWKWLQIRPPVKSNRSAEWRAEFVERMRKARETSSASASECTDSQV